MSEKPQFDSLLGGKFELPSSVRVLRVAAARCQEIKAMRKNLTSGSTGSKLIFQTLPKYMRRRVMSHTAKRLPRRLREIHLNQLKKSGLPPKQKRPSRKYRRRPSNLLAEYSRRQRKVRWLETHIWHAKRFHVVDRWGYKIPYSPCDKAFRACYRATAKHCLLQDVSYYGCLQINGRESEIVNNIRKICDLDEGLSIGAMAFIKGNREGKLTLFNSDLKKRTPIGRVSFNWMPNINGQLRSLWIWIHCAHFVEVLNTFISLFKLQEANGSYTNLETGISVHDLRYELNRFRLTGPLAHAILHKSLNCLEFNKYDSKNSWLKDYLTDSNASVIKSQIEYWKNIEHLSSPSELSPHVILSLIVEDPRYNMPKVRTKALPKNYSIHSKFLCNFPENLGFGPIWDPEVRTKVKETQMPTSKILEMRSNLLVPGTDLGTPGMPIPIMLIQRPGNREDRLGYCSGWDVILPGGWAQAAWITMIMWGARAGGLRESESMEFETGKPHHMEPDTSAGKDEENRLYDLRKDKYFKMPPNRRTNYTKLAIVSPFRCDWNMLLKDWCSGNVSGEEFQVLRHKIVLHQLYQALNYNNCDVSNVDFDAPYLVPVKVIMEAKGCPTQSAIICVPKRQDLSKISIVKEPLRMDSNQGKRKKFREEHKKLLKKIRISRIKERKTGKGVKVDSKLMNAITDYKEKMEKLWVPEVVNIRDSCSREVMGFVTKGGYSFTLGQSAGVGYVTMNSLKSLLSQKCRNRILIRNTTSRQYRIAKLDIAI